MQQAPMISKVVLLLACLIAAVLAGTTTIPTHEYRAGLRVHPFHGIPTPNFYFIDGATVSIEFGYVPDHDRLLFDYQGEFPITGIFDNVLGVLHLSGRATTSEYANALESVIFITSSEDGRPRQVTYTLGPRTFYYTLSQHYYRYFHRSGLSWEDARSACSATNYFNMRGYLATVTSSDEQAQIASKANFTMWLGGNDIAEEGVWRWVTGPEGLEVNGTGQVFWRGRSMYGGGATPEHGFAAWNRFQPSNGDGEGEDYLRLVNSLDRETSYWADTANVAPVEGFICEYGGLDDEETEKNMAQYTSSARLFLECGLFTSRTECNNRDNMGCQWSAGACSQVSCARHHTQEECDYDFMCHWNVDGLMGVCANTPCAAFDASACPSDICTVRQISGVSQCWPGECADKSESCTCAAMPGCVWRSNQCGYERGADCSGMDIIYLLDGSETMSEVFGRYDHAFRGLVDVFINAQMVLTGTSAGADVDGSTYGQRVGFVQYGRSAWVSTSDIGSQGRLTGNDDEADADLEFHLDNFRRSTTRTINEALRVASDMFGSSHTGRKRIVVAVAAGEISDAASIVRQYSADSRGSGSLAQLKQKNVTLVGVALRPTGPETMSSLQAAASLDTLIGDGSNPPVLRLHIDDILDEVVFGMCGGTGLSQAVQEAAPSMLCSDHHTPDRCMEDQMCAWDAASQMCSNTACLANCDEQTCSTDPTCHINGGACVEYCVSLNSTTCGELEGIESCYFNYNADACQPISCVANPTEDGCIADTDACEYSPIASPKCQPLPCAASSAEVCNALTGCKWSGVACYQNICQNFTSAARCGDFVQCQWNPFNNVCEVLEVCGEYTNEKQCSGDNRCEWYVTQPPGACGPARCSYLNIDSVTAESRCKSDSACVWQLESENRFMDMCVPKTCDLLHTSCECSTLEGCVWRNGTCRDNRFVQCPAMDVVFLVEGTPVILDAFGRHPNGYYGITEAIRSWSHEAPFSTVEDEAGFRVALINYGAPRLALSVPPTIGGGGNLTGDLDKWVSPNSELDWNQHNIEEYAKNGNNGDVAIKPALHKALETFQRSGGAKRQKLLVILGHSAITDGDRMLNREIDALEEMGVQIFGTILRRFSYITPVDERSADFMRPLVSDPHSAHFMFTTIDDMKRSLLDDFCDPSSITGEILRISRDGELPCSWLQTPTECGIQGTCAWNASAMLTCPEAGQCPNLDCQRLPEALNLQFECHNCRLVSGAFDCSLGFNFAPPRGLCQRAPCMHECESSCSASGTCEWKGESSRCERKMCQYTSQGECNADMGCVWSQDGVTGAESGVCERSVCGRMRSSDTCNGKIIIESSGSYYPCKLNRHVAPAVCLQERCPKLNADGCAADEQSTQSQCEFLPAAPNRRCRNRMCTHTASELCEMDGDCFWDDYRRSCRRRTESCILSGYSEWAPCTASCGSATTFKSRSVLQFPSSMGTPCDVEANRNCVNTDGTEVSNCAPGDNSVVVIRSCARNDSWTPPFPNRPQINGGWPDNCEDYCASKTDDGRQACVSDNSCIWVGATCRVKPFMGCVTLDQDECTRSNMCSFDSTVGACVPVVTVCQYETQAACVGDSACQWKDGSNANALARSLSIPSQLYNPGQKPIYPFVGLFIESNDVINGATVVIETNYQRGKDVLDIAFTREIRTHWVEQSGLLQLSGRATIAEYARAIRFTTFHTTSTRKVARTITWSFGNNTVYSSLTKHHYRAVSNMGADFYFAKAWCHGKELYGLRGYLATVMSAAENDIISSKALGVGWVSGGDNGGSGRWTIQSGPESGEVFWRGGSISMGGGPVEGGYSNWLHPNVTNINGEPVRNIGGGGATDQNRVYVARSGFWESRLADSLQVDGYTCEFGGLPDDVRSPFPIGGAMIVGVGGCVAQMCVWHSTQRECEQDIECTWANNMCQAGCGSFGTETECESAAVGCRWDTAVVPATCDINKCARLSMSACSLDIRCQWTTEDSCDYREGCARYDQLAECNNEPTCMWLGAGCVDRPCHTYANFRTCRRDGRCRWDAGATACTQAFCIAGTRDRCVADRDRCTWASVEPHSVGFTPNGATILPFAEGVEAPTDINTQIDGITVMIMLGFQRGSDMLSVSPGENVDQAFMITYNAETGVMRIRPTMGVHLNALMAFNFLRRSVRFSTTSNSLQRRRIAFVYSANTFYSSESGKFFKYVNRVANTMEEARAVCQSQTLFGVPGHLATVEGEGDNMYLTRLSAKGWLSASSDADNEWSWTMPNGTQRAFWRGQGALGVPVALRTVGNFTFRHFARWAPGQPALPSTFAYFLDDGTWIVIRANDFPPHPGVICEFDASSRTMTSVVYEHREANPVGCFVAPCLSLSRTECQSDSACLWRTDLNNGRGGCARDTSCLSGMTPTTCSGLELCHWDYDRGSCLGTPQTICSVRDSETKCAALSSCEWNPLLLPRNSARGLGACVFQGCQKYTTSHTCAADPTCQWSRSNGLCTRRLCGYVTPSSCWRDPLCMWARGDVDACTVTPCSALQSNRAACLTTDSCAYNETLQRCEYQRCSTRVGKARCHSDMACLWTNDECTMPNCNYPTQTACQRHAQCFFSVSDRACQVQQCVANTNRRDCEGSAGVPGGARCIWEDDASFCRAPRFGEQGATRHERDKCEEEKNPNLWWLWLMLTIIIMLLGVIFHRLYLAWGKGQNFFEPTRKNYKYSPHQMYASELFEEAKIVGQETNLVAPRT